MKVVISGGTGFIGRTLCHRLSEAGHHVTVLTRDLPRAWRLLGTGPALLQWEGIEVGNWEQALEDADAVVNLAGASIADARWTSERKRLLLESRLSVTRRLVEAMARRARRKVVFVSASGIGYYGANDTGVFDERAPRGSGFLADLSAAWEAEARRAETIGARVVPVRIGMVLERDGGALARMLLPFRFGLGGPILPGTQWVSWIHREDLIGLIEWVLADATISGPINAVAPGAVRMADFCRTLATAMHRPCWFPVPEFAVKLGLGELGTLLTTGQRVTPAVALSRRYLFHYPELAPALTAILEVADQVAKPQSASRHTAPPVGKGT